MAWRLRVSPQTFSDDLSHRYVGWVERVGSCLPNSDPVMPDMELHPPPLSMALRNVSNYYLASHNYANAEDDNPR